MFVGECSKLYDGFLGNATTTKKGSSCCGRTFAGFLRSAGNQAVKHFGQCCNVYTRTPAYVYGRLECALRHVAMAVESVEGDGQESFSDMYLLSSDSRNGCLQKILLLREHLKKIVSGVQNCGLLPTCLGRSCCSLRKVPRGAMAGTTPTRYPYNANFTQSQSVYTLGT